MEMIITRYLLIVLFLSVFSYVNAFQIQEKVVSNTKEEIIPQAKKKLVYIVSDIKIPFWQIMARGIKNSSNELNYEVEIFDAQNIAKKELELTIKAIKDNVSGIIVSPTNSSACVTILKLAKNAGIPVVISDIGTDKGEYVSYISSNNKDGAYKIGKVLSKNMIELGWETGKVGIVAIPQKRLNGQARTAGFMQAMDEANIKGADIKQLITWTKEETYNYVKDMLDNYQNLRAIWLQTSDKYKEALRAISDAGKKDNVLLVSFDAEPEFLDLIPQGILLGAAMQQPYLMGEEAVKAMHKHLNNQNVQKNIQLPILAISAKNIAQQLPIIKRNVLGIINE